MMLNYFRIKRKPIYNSLLAIVSILYNFAHGETVQITQTISVEIAGHEEGSVHTARTCGGSGQIRIMFTTFDEGVHSFLTEPIPSQSNPIVEPTKAFFGGFGRFAPSADCSTVYAVGNLEIVERDFDSEGDIVEVFAIPPSEGTDAERISLNPSSGHLYVAGLWNRVHGAGGFLQIDPLQQRIIGAISGPELDSIIRSSVFDFVVSPDTGNFIVIEADRIEDFKIWRFSSEGDVLDIFELPTHIGKHARSIALDRDSHNFIVPGGIITDGDDLSHNFIFFVLAPGTGADSSWRNYE